MNWIWVSLEVALAAHLEQLTEHGGHVGFIGGTLRRPKMWLETRIPDWLTPWLEKTR